MRFLPLFLIGFSFLSFSPYALGYGVSYSVEVGDVIDKRNISMVHPDTDEKYLVRVGNGCDYMKPGQPVKLVIQGSLSSNGDDRIRVDDIHSCPIEEVRLYTHRYYVDFTFRSNTEARLVGGNDRSFNVQYPSACAALRGYTKQYIYARQGSDDLSASDRLLLPNGSECSAGYVKRIGQETETLGSVVKSEGVRPSAVSHVKAFPRDGAVFLEWSPATDNGKVDHYLIHVHRGKINPKGVSPDSLSTIKVDETRYTVENLSNELTYYFYLIAVDDEGNTSSDWSAGVSATPKSSIFNGRESSSTPPDMNVRILSESRLSVVVKWDPVKSADRYVVILENEGKREWVKTEYPKSYLRVLKRPHRYNKTLKVIIRAYLPVDFVEEQSIEFQIEE